MTLEQYWTIMLKQWKLIVISFLLVGLGALIGSKFITPLYQSTVLVQVTIRAGANQTNYDSLLASDQLVQTEAQLATSDQLLGEVALHYSGLTPEELSKEVTATPRFNTQLFEIDVLEPDPTRAAALANDIAATLIKQQVQLAQQDNLQSQQQLQQDLQLTQKQIDTTTAQIATLQANNGNSVQVNTLKVRLSSLQEHYSQVEAVVAQLELTEAQNSSFLRIAQPAQPALKPARPNILLNIGVGFMTGLLLGMLLAVLFERLDTRVRTSEILTQLLGWPVLATVWQARAKEVVINPTGHNANVESYRILRTNIGFSNIDKPLHTLIVTSATSHDGKSVVAANLAVFMAKAGKNTLLIDADLRRPVQHEQFGLPAHTKGFSNAILAFGMPATTNAPAYQQVFTPMTSTVPSSTPADPRTPSLDPFVHAVDIPSLVVMPSGPLPPNPPELLDSKAMQRLFTALAGCGAEVVIFDTPPLLGLSDASILAAKVDGILVVVDITRANKGNLKQVKALLEQAGTRIIGCVVNKQRRRRNDMAYSYYYSTDKQKTRSSRSTKNANSAAVTSDGLRQSEMQSELDLPDNSVKMVPVPPLEADMQSQLSLFDRNMAKTPIVHPIQPEAQTWPDQLDGRKGG